MGALTERKQTVMKEKAKEIERDIMANYRKVEKTLKRPKGFTAGIIKELCELYEETNGDDIAMIRELADRTSKGKMYSFKQRSLLKALYNCIEDRGETHLKNLIRMVTPNKVRLAATAVNAGLGLTWSMVNEARMYCYEQSLRKALEEVKDSTGILGRLKCSYLYHPVYNAVYDYIEKSETGYGIVLAGEPGTGKSSFASLLYNTYTVSAKEELRDLTKEWAECLNRQKRTLVIDDVDFLIPKGREGSAVEKANLKSLLDVLDVVRRVVLTTNNPDALDKALTRAGRADKVFYVGNVERDAAEIILRLALANYFNEADERTYTRPSGFEYLEFFLHKNFNCKALLDMMVRDEFISLQKGELYPPSGIAGAVPRLVNTLRTRQTSFTGDSSQEPLKEWLSPTKYFAAREANGIKQAQLLESVQLFIGDVRVWGGILRTLSYDDNEVATKSPSLISIGRGLFQKDTPYRNDEDNDDWSDDEDDWSDAD